MPNERAPATTTVTCRFPKSVVADLLVVEKELAATVPEGVQVKRSDAVRVLVTEALKHRKEVRACQASPEAQTPK